MDFLEYFGLSFDPFEKNALKDRQSFLSNDHQKASSALSGALSRNGIALITARSGLGKSHVIDQFLGSLDSGTHPHAYVVPGIASPIDLYRLLCSGFKLDPSGNRQRLLSRLQAFLYSTYARNRPAVIVIDEAHDLKITTLAELRILRNFEHDSIDVFTLILTGEPSLASVIQTRDSLDSLHQRITNHYRFNGLSNDEVTAYVNHKLAFAGGSDFLVDPGAYQVLCDSSQGISRTIDHIMSDALRWGFQLRHQTIDAEIMQHAVDSQALV